MGSFGAGSKDPQYEILGPKAVTPKAPTTLVRLASHGLRATMRDIELDSTKALNVGEEQLELPALDIVREQ